MQQVLSAQCALFRGVPSLLFLFPVFGGYGKYTRCMRRRNNQRGQSHSLVYKCFHAAFPFYPCGRNHFFQGASFFVSSRSCFLPGMQLRMFSAYEQGSERSPVDSCFCAASCSPALPSSCCCCCPQFPGCCLQLQRPSHVTCAPSHPNLYWLFKTIIDTSFTSFWEEA